MIQPTDAAPEGQLKSVRHRRGVLLSVATTLILLASAAIITKQLIGQIDIVREQVRTLRLTHLFWPLLATLIAIIVDTLCWHRAVAASAGRAHALHFSESFAILNASNLSKYLPGKVWAYGLQAHILRTRGVAVTATLHANLTISAAAITAAGWLLAFGALWLPNRAAGVGGAAVLAVLLTGLHLYYGPVVARLVEFIRRFGWSLPIEPISRRTYLALVLFYVANLLLLGAAAAYVLAELNGPLAPARFAAVTIITAVSWLVGYAAFFVPAGLGVRETAMLAMLSRVGLAGSAVLVPLVTRVLLLAGEALFGGIGVLVLWRLAARRR
jgi:hypothetical protein